MAIFQEKYVWRVFRRDIPIYTVEVYLYFVKNGREIDVFFFLKRVEVLVLYIHIYTL